jgi:hypothetical protein
MAGRISIGAPGEVVSAVTERYRAEKGRILDAAFQVPTAPALFPAPPESIAQSCLLKIAAWFPNWNQKRDSQLRQM